MLLVYPIVSSFSLIASGLKCNSCSSYISFEDCFKQRQMTGVHCDEDYNCGKSYYKYKGRDVYSLSCVSITHCNNSNNMCHANLQMSDCHVTCCREDLCNTTSIPVASVFFVSACLVGTFMMSWKMGWWQSFASLIACFVWSVLVKIGRHSLCVRENYLDLCLCLHNIKLYSSFMIPGA